MPNRLQILVVDDDGADRAATRGALCATDLEAEIHEAADIPDALQAICARRFDCVLTAYHLPRGDGLGLLRAARELGVDCPFVVLTGRGHEQMAVELMKAGVADYLVKALVTPERLGQAVRHATRVHRAELLRAEAQERQRNYAAQLKGLADASLAINAATSLAQLIETLTRSAARVIGAHQAATRVIAGPSPAPLYFVHLSSKYPEGRAARAERASSAGHGFGTALETGLQAEPLEHAGFEAQLRQSDGPLCLTQAELERHPQRGSLLALKPDAPPPRGLLAAPLVSRDGKKLGLVQLSDKYEGDFNDEDAAVLVQLARFASLSVENAGLLARAQLARQNAEASASRIARLQAITAALSHPGSVAQISEAIVAQAVTMLGAQRVALFAVEGDRLKLCAHRNLEPERARAFAELALDDTYLAAKSVRERRPIYLADPDEYARIAAVGARPRLWDANTGSVLCVPLQLFDAEPAAVIGMSFEHPHQFDEDERAFFESLADQWAQAIDRARLHESERTARQQAELAREQAETANRLKDEFLATVSHELRTPLQAILGWARLLRNQPLDEPAIRGVEIIERNARAQARLIDDILDVSRIITGKLRLNPRRVNVEALVQAAADTMGAAADAKHITIALTFGAELGAIVGDADRLQQVVWNLLSNAVKFTPANGRIDVDAERLEHQVVLRVRDTGCGIEPEFLPHVFERFRQADASTTRAHAGLGLGLAIVRHLTELHGGRVSAHSTGRDQGATFTVELPVRSAQPPLSAEDWPELPPRANGLELSHGLAEKRVLVVGDQPDARELIAAVFTRAGARVASAVSVAEACEKLAEFRPDVVVSELGLPDADGFALLRRVRALGQPLRDVPVVALTGLTRPEQRKHALLAGFTQHLTKPVDPQRLLAAVARVLEPRLP